MKTKLILITFATLLFVGGCKTRKIVNDTNSYQRNDSTVYINVVDTFIKWLPQKQGVKTNQKSKLATDFSFSTAWIDSTGLLNHFIENFPVVPSKIIVKKITVNKNSKLEITKTITIKEKETKYIVKNKWGILDWIGLFALIYFAIKIYLKFKK